MRKMGVSAICKSWLLPADHQPRIIMKIMKNNRLVLTTAASVLRALGVSARAATLNNDFSIPYDYVANGIIGDTNWDGVYLRFGDIPAGSAGGSGNGNTVIANTSSPYPGFLNLQEI